MSKTEESSSGAVDSVKKEEPTYSYPKKNRKKASPLPPLASAGNRSDGSLLDENNYSRPKGPVADSNSFFVDKDGLVGEELPDERDFRSKKGFYAAPKGPDASSSYQTGKGEDVDVSPVYTTWDELGSESSDAPPLPQRNQKSSQAPASPAPQSWAEKRRDLDPDSITKSGFQVSFLKDINSSARGNRPANPQVVNVSFFNNSVFGKVNHESLASEDKIDALRAFVNFAAEVNKAAEPQPRRGTMAAIRSAFSRILGGRSSGRVDITSANGTAPDYKGVKVSVPEGNMFKLSGLIEELSELSIMDENGNEVKAGKAVAAEVKKLNDCGVISKEQKAELDDIVQKAGNEAERMVVDRWSSRQLEEGEESWLEEEPLSNHDHDDPLPNPFGGKEVRVTIEPINDSGISLSAENKEDYLKPEDDFGYKAHAEVRKEASKSNHPKDEPLPPLPPSSSPSPAGRGASCITSSNVVRGWGD